MLQILVEEGLLSPKDRIKALNVPSKEEIQEITASMGGVGNPFLFPDPEDDWYDDDSEDTITPQPIQPKQCEHKWKWYVGLAKAYYFCEKCGEEVDEI